MPRMAGEGDQEPKEPPFTWPRTARDIAVRLIDRGHLNVLVGLSAMGLIAYIVARLPNEAMTRLPDVGVALAQNDNLLVAVLFATSAIQLFANFVLVSLVLLQRRVYRGEVDRMAVTKRELEVVVDPSRPRLADEGAGRKSLPGTGKKPK